MMASTEYGHELAQGRRSTIGAPARPGQFGGRGEVGARRGRGSTAEGAGRP